MVQIYNEITIYFYKAIFLPGGPLRGDRPPGPRREGTPPSALPHVEECTYFWGVNTSWGINMAESKDLYAAGKTFELYSLDILGLIV
jgi:hypothetical protein